MPDACYARICVSVLAVASTRLFRELLLNMALCERRLSRCSNAPAVVRKQILASQRHGQSTFTSIEEIHAKLPLANVVNPYINRLVRAEVMSKYIDGAAGGSRSHKRIVLG